MPGFGRPPKAARRVGVITYIPCPTRSPDEQIVDIEDINSSGQAVGEVVRVEPGVASSGPTGTCGRAARGLSCRKWRGNLQATSNHMRLTTVGIVGHSFVGATLWTIK